MRRSLLALAAALLLTACNQGGDQQGTAPATAAPNDADVTFTQNMIPHHQQAIEMAKLVNAHTKRPQLRTLAEDIASSQGQEITLMQGWLKSWGKPATPEGMDHGAMQMPGMMSELEMRQLGVINGEDFDLLFLEMMTAHHEGAIEMPTPSFATACWLRSSGSPSRSSTPSRPRSTSSTRRSYRCQVAGVGTVWLRTVNISRAT